MKLLRPLAGYTLYNHKTNDSSRQFLNLKFIIYILSFNFLKLSRI